MLRLLAGRHRIGYQLLADPTAWTIGRLYRRLGQPAMSLPTCTGACMRSPAGGDPDREQVLANPRQTISDLPDGAVLLAEDETHINLLPGCARPGLSMAPATRS